MVRPAEQSRPDTRHRLTGSWLLRKWTPSQPSPTKHKGRDNLYISSGRDWRLQDVAELLHVVQQPTLVLGIRLKGDVEEGLAHSGFPHLQHVVAGLGPGCHPHPP